MIEIRGLTKRYGTLVAVDRLDLTINRGEWFIFVGPNAAGKTTTVKMLMGLLPPDSGEATLLDFNTMRDHLELKKLAGYLPEDFFCYPYLSGREYLEFVADVHRIREKEKQRRIDDLLDLLDFHEVGRRRTREYSHGTRRKLGLLAALVHKPRVLFLDEPTAGMDPNSAFLIRQLLRRLADAGTTIFMCTHILGSTEKMCDRIGIINEGRILKQSTLAELSASYPDMTFEQIFVSLTGGVDEKRIEEFVNRSFPGKEHQDR